MMSAHSFIGSTPPPEWSSVPFWAIFRRRKLTGYPKEELLSVYRDYGVIPKTSRDNNHNKESDDLSGYQLVTKGSLVTNKMKAWQGSIAISRYRGIVSPAYYVYEPLSSEHDQYLHYLLRSAPFVALYQRISKGIRNNQWDLEHEALRTIPVLLPDLDTQREIADFLDRETARIDLLIEKKRDFVNLLKEKRQTIISHAVTKGLNPSTLMKPSGIEWLGEVPEHWDINRLKWSMTCCRNGIWGGEAQQDDGDIACVRVADFDRENLRVELDEPTIRNVPKKNRDGRLLHQGNLLLEKSGGGETQPVGCVVLFDDPTPAVCSNFVARIAIADEMDSSFWRYVHAAAYAVRLNTRSIKQVTGIQNLDSSKYFDERVACPSPTEQTAIADFLDRETAKIDDLATKTQHTINLLQERRAALITTAVTGQIDVGTYKKSGQAERQLDQLQQEAKR